MAHERFMARVQLGALLLMIGVAVELIRYTYRSFDRALTFAFWEPDRWNKHHLVDPGTVIELGARLGYFAIWGTIIVLSILSFLAGLHVLNQVRKGLVFDERVARALRWLGMILGLTMAADLMYHAIDPWLITRYNAEPLPLRWGYDPSDIKTFALTMILFLFGWVMQQSIEIDRQNREFV